VVYFVFLRVYILESMSDMSETDIRETEPASSGGLRFKGGHVYELWNGLQQVKAEGEKGRELGELLMDLREVLVEEVEVDGVKNLVPKEEVEVGWDLVGRIFEMDSVESWPFQSRMISAVHQETLNSLAYPISRVGLLKMAVRKGKDKDFLLRLLDEAGEEDYVSEARKQYLDFVKFSHLIKPAADRVTLEVLESRDSSGEDEETRIIQTRGDEWLAILGRTDEVAGGLIADLKRMLSWEEDEIDIRGELLKIVGEDGRGKLEFFEQIYDDFRLNLERGV